jgi:hypothetical protein
LPPLDAQPVAPAHGDARRGFECPYRRPCTGDLLMVIDPRIDYEIAVNPAEAAVRQAAQVD